jgi:hypothetical protein
VSNRQPEPKALDIDLLVENTEAIIKEMVSSMGFWIWVGQDGERVRRERPEPKQETWRDRPPLL